MQSNAHFQELFSLNIKQKALYIILLFRNVISKLNQIDSSKHVQDDPVTNTTAINEKKHHFTVFLNLKIFIYWYVFFNQPFVFISGRTIFTKRWLKRIEGIEDTDVGKYHVICSTLKMVGFRMLLHLIVFLCWYYFSSYYYKLYCTSMLCYMLLHVTFNILLDKYFRLH